ncbi:MAG: phage tail protein, partial [Trebonia sp.]
MSEPFLGEIRLFSMGFAPKDWALCDGQLLAISQNQALFSILGTTYGGDGIQTFALPDLRGRVPVHTGNDVTLGQQLGAESQTLTSAEMAEHTHTVQG